MVLDDPDRTVERLGRLRSAIIDACSIIYARKAAFLDTLSRTLELSTLPGVIAEVGVAEPGIAVLPAEPREGPVDRQLIQAARGAGEALISDDREVHERADELGIPCYNALVMLECALLKGRLSLAEWDACRKRLLAAASYHPRIVHAAGEIHWAVRKLVG